MASTRRRILKGSLLVTLVLGTGTVVFMRAPGVGLPGIAAEDYPRVDTCAATAMLGRMLAARALGIRTHVLRFGLTKGAGVRTSDLAYEPARLPEPRKKEHEDLLAAKARQGSNHECYLNVINGVADLGLVVREPLPEETAAAQATGVELDARPIGRDALVFIVHRDNPVTGLTRAQVASIFSGQTTMWDAVGGAPEAIMAYTRERASDSAELMPTLALQGRPVVPGPDRLIMTMVGTVEAIGRNPLGLACTVWQYHHTMLGNTGTRELAVDGVRPTPRTIADRHYPLGTPVCAVIRRDAAPDSPERRVRDWLLRDAGQRLVARSGLVPARGQTLTIKEQ